MGNEDWYYPSGYLQRNMLLLEYDESFVDSRIELSPLRMPLGKKVYEFPGLAGEPFTVCRDWWRIHCRTGLAMRL